MLWDVNLLKSHSGTPHTRPTLLTASHRRPVPIPAYEEEIEDTGEPDLEPGVQCDDYRGPRDPRAASQHRKDAPYLMFEITSEEGFHVRSESMEGEFSLFLFRLNQRVGECLADNSEVET